MPETRTIGGTVSGLLGDRLTLQNDGGDDLVIEADGDFTFATPVELGKDFAVTILRQPQHPRQLCEIDASVVTSGAAGDAPSVSITCRLVVEPLYASAPAWNDYLKDDGTDALTASEIPCGDPDSEGYDCLHAGLLRTFTVPNVASCAGLHADDDARALVWSCDETEDGVRLTSTALGEGSTLVDLLDLASLTWRPLAVTVTKDGSPLLTTARAPLWPNPVLAYTAGAPADSPGGVYVVTSDVTTKIDLAADGVSLVIPRGVVVHGQSGTLSVVEANGKRYLWIEGTVDGRGSEAGVRLEATRFATLDDIAVAHTDAADGVGVLLKNASFIRMRDVQAVGNGVGVAAIYSTRLTMQDVVAAANATDGVRFDHTGESTLTNVLASGNGKQGLSLASSSNNVLTTVDASNNGGTGVKNAASDKNTFTALTALRNQDGVYVVSSSRLTFTGVTTSQNRGRGLWLQMAGSIAASGVTARQNATEGVRLQGASLNVLTNVVADANTTVGVALIASGKNELANVEANDNAVDGVFLSQSAENKLVNVAARRNTTRGLYLLESFDNRLDGLTTELNTHGLVAWSASDNLLAHVTAAKNTGRGLWIEGASHNLLLAVVSAQNTDDGMLIANTANNRVVGYAAANNGGAAVHLLNTSTNTFTRALRLFGNASQCNVSGGTAPGLTAVTCANDGSSDAALATGQNIVDAFAADYALFAADTTLRGALGAPSGADVITHVWYDNPATTFVPQASERYGDGVGDDDLLCEMGEACVLAQNLGRYQGHGNVVSAGALSPGLVSDVTMWAYETNGY